MQPQYITNLRLIDRFWSRIDKSGPVPEKCPELGPCWLWTGGIHKGRGCGQFVVAAYRFSWELHHGPILKGIDIHHLCEKPLCVNPLHLKPLTRSEHKYAHGHGHSHPETECCHGHALTPANISRTSSGAVRCLACSRESMKAYRAAHPLTPMEKKASNKAWRSTHNDHCAAYLRDWRRKRRATE